MRKADVVVIGGSAAPRPRSGAIQGAIDGARTQRSESAKRLSFSYPLPA